MSVSSTALARAALIASFFLIAFVAGGPALAQVDNRYAILVGVSDYPVGLRKLEGPKSDVKLVFDQLKREGFKTSNITVLADSMGAGITAQRPTKNAIVQALKDLAGKAPSGSQILFYYSGHGSHVPAKNRAEGSEEPDGTDEVLLPIDVGLWDPAIGAVGNTLSDNELGVLINGFIDKNIFVWMVVDACHSGTISRGAGATVRQVSPAALGIPAAAFSAPRESTRSGGSTRTSDSGYFNSEQGSDRGRFVGFYASYPDQEAIELQLPQEAPASAQKRHGILTYALVKALRQKSASTYSDLALTIQGGYATTTGVLPVKQMPTPFFEGDLDKRPFIGAGSARNRLYPVEVTDQGISVLAGLLDDIDTGSILTLSRADTGVPLAKVRVVDAGPQSSRSEIIGAASKLAEIRALTSPGECPEGCVLQAKLESTRTSFTIRVTRNFQEADAPSRPIVEKALAGLKALPAAQRPVAFEEAAANRPGDVELRLIGSSLWVLPPNAELPDGKSARFPPIAIDASFGADQLGQALRTVTRSLNLSRIASALSSTSQTKALTAALYIDSVAAAAPGQCSFPASYPTAIPASAKPIQAAAGGGRGVELAHCQVLYARLTNKGAATLDITPLYIEADYGISYLGPVEAALRIPPNGTVIVAVPIVTQGTHAGIEQLIILAIERPERSATAADLRRLAAPGLSRLGVRGPALASRSGSPLAALYEDAVSGDGSVRSGQVAIGNSDAGALRWTLQTVPK